MTETPTPTVDLPRFVRSVPVSNHRWGHRDVEGWPKRNSVIVFPTEGKRSDTLWRVAKVGSRNDSWPMVYLVPVHEVPAEGTTGQARTHYGNRTRYYQTDPAALAKAGARIVVMDGPEAEEFVADAIAAQAEDARLSLVREEQYKVAPSGGVADGIADVAKNLPYRADDQRKEAVSLEYYAQKLDTEAELIPNEVVADNVRAVATKLRVYAQFLRDNHDKIKERAEALSAVVEQLRSLP